MVSFKGIPEDDMSDNLVFDIEDEVVSICRTFSLQSKKQETNLIETLKQTCRKIVRETEQEKNHIQLLILQEFNELNWIFNSLYFNLVDRFFLDFAYWY